MFGLFKKKQKHEVVDFEQAYDDWDEFDNVNIATKVDGVIVVSEVPPLVKFPNQKCISVFHYKVFPASIIKRVRNYIKPTYKLRSVYHNVLGAHNGQFEHSFGGEAVSSKSRVLIRITRTMKYSEINNDPMFFCKYIDNLAKFISAGIIKFGGVPGVTVEADYSSKDLIFKVFKNKRRIAHMYYNGFNDTLELELLGNKISVLKELGLIMKLLQFGEDYADEVLPAWEFRKMQDNIVKNYNVAVKLVKDLQSTSDDIKSGLQIFVDFKNGKISGREL